MISPSVLYQEVPGSETFLGDSTQRKRNHTVDVWKLELALTPPHKPSGKSVPPCLTHQPCDPAATATIPPDVSQHMALLLNSVLYISVNPKAASFVIRESAAQSHSVQLKPNTKIILENQSQAHKTHVDVFVRD